MIRIPGRIRHVTGVAVDLGHVPGTDQWTLPLTCMQKQIQHIFVSEIKCKESWQFELLENT